MRTPEPPRRATWPRARDVPRTFSQLDNTLREASPSRKRAPRVTATPLQSLLDGIIFFGLLLIVFLTAVPYGTVEPWSHAAFQSAIFFLGLLWTVHGFLRGSWRTVDLSLFFPLIALIVFAALQSLPWSTRNIAGVRLQNTLSADPFESWIFALRLSALTLAGILAARFVTSSFRLSLLVHALILVAVLSAIFGLVRLATQHEQGFLLTYLNAGGGFGQFINRNHFAYLVEAGFGLLAGIALLGGDRNDRLLIYLSAILLLWVALVMSHSRGGLLAVTVQIVCGALIFIYGRPRVSNKRRAGLVISVATALVIAVITVGGVIWLGGDQLSTGVETVAIEMAKTNTEHEGSRRSDIWRATWRMARAHPIAGAGLGGFWAEVPAYHDASGLQTPQQAHNDYLELIASGGVIAAAIFVWFIVTLLRKSRGMFGYLSGFQRGAALGALLGLVGIGVHSLVEFGLHITINALIFVLLLSILSVPAFDQRPFAQAHRNGAFN